jgi:hypothetical protein
MAVSFQSVQDALFAFITIAGIAIIFALGIIAASALSERDKARHARIMREAKRAGVTHGGPVLAQHPTSSDDRELVLH